jgi:phenylacetate-CoA ligase
MPGALRAMLPASAWCSVSYHTMRSFYARAQWWSMAEIRSWQLRKLQETLLYAYTHVPGYRALYKAAGVHPNDVNHPDDLARFPCVDKTMLRDNPQEFRSTHIPAWRQQYVTTGGSSGVPLGFYQTRKNMRIEDAFMHSAWATTEWRLSDTGATLRGGYVGSEKDIAIKYGLRRYELSSYYLTQDSYPRYRDFLKRHRCTFLHAYPSSAADFARYAITHGDAGTSPVKQIFLGSENLYTWQRELIKTAFPDTRVMTWYGHSEKAIWAPWCEETEHYHLCPFYGFTEMTGSDGSPVQEHDVGELVGTSFWMRATPFIRYRTGDYARKGPAQCGSCNRNFPLMTQIDGRLCEIIVSRTGRRISMTAINMHDATFNHVRQFRFVQRAPGALTLQIVAANKWDQRKEQELQLSVAHKLGPDFELSIEPVSNIPRSPSGKHTFLEQHLPVTHADRVT